MAIVTVTGCSTTVVPPSQAISASKEHVFKYQENEGNNGSLTIVRDSGFVGAGCYATVYLNGERVAKLDPKEKRHFIYQKESGLSVLILKVKDFAV